MTQVHPCAPAAGSRVVIIGAGIAGLSAAAALASVRHPGDSSPVFEVVLLEARRVTGGRAGSFADAASGETVDYCQHVAMGCCTNFIDLLKQTGLVDRFTEYRELNFYHPATGGSTFRPSSILPAPLHLNSALAGLQHLTRKQRLRIRIGLWQLMRTPESALQNTLAAVWLAEHRQDVELRRRFWDAILVSALGDLPERVSMAAARKVLIDGFAAATGASHVWVPNAPLSHLFNDHLREVLRTRGVEIRTEATARQIQCSESAPPHGRARIRLADGTTLPADHVVLATSWRAAARLVQTMELTGAGSVIQQWQRQVVETMESVVPSPITGLHLWFDRVLTPLPHVVMLGGIADWLFRQPIPAQNDSAGHYHQVVISGRHELSEASQETLVEQVVGELRAAFPLAREAQLLRSRVVTDPAAVYSVSPEFESRRVASGTPLPWLHLAGDYVQTGWPATMEGATISGRLAADCLLRKCGVNLPGLYRSAVLPGLRPGRLASWCIV